MAGAASQAGDADSSRAPGLTSCLQGSVNVHRGALLLVTQWQCISSFVFYIFVTCSLCRVELVVQFPARGSTQVLLCLFPDVLWLWHFLYSVGSQSHPGHSWRVRLAKQETLTPPGHLVSLLVCRGPWMSIVVLYCWWHSDSASVLLYFTFLSLVPFAVWSWLVQFPARGSTQVLLCLFPDVLWLWHFLYSVGSQSHPGHSWRVRLAKQETLTPPGHLVSLLVCRGPWMSIVVLYCWWHSDSASVLLYFTFLSLVPFAVWSW